MNQPSRQELAQQGLQLVDHVLAQLLDLFGGEPFDALEGIGRTDLNFASYALKAQMQSRLSYEDREWASQLSDIRRRVNALTPSARLARGGPMPIPRRR